jgi:hypothetical protein
MRLNATAGLESGWVTPLRLLKVAKLGMRHIQ